MDYDSFPHLWLMLENGWFWRVEGVFDFDIRQ